MADAADMIANGVDYGVTPPAPGGAPRLSGHAIDLLLRMTDAGARLHPTESLTLADELVRVGCAEQVLVGDRLGYRRTALGRAVIASLPLAGEAAHG